MSWLYIPDGFTSCRSVRASADSTSASGSPIRQPDAFAMSMGKPMRPTSLCAAWMTKHWMKRLSSLTFDPSTATRGVARWIASLPDSPANRSPAPAGGSASATPGTSGRTSEGSSARQARECASSRTSAPIYERASSGSTTTFSRWATELRRACSPRQRSARTIKGNGCSSLPTVVVSDSFGGRNRTSRRPEDSRHHGGTTLTDLLLGQHVVGGKLATDLRLNPCFTERMLGWPTRWTGSALAATEWCRWWRLMRGAFSRLRCDDGPVEGIASTGPSAR